METEFIENQVLRIEYLKKTLRIIGVIPKGKSNLLADLRDFSPVHTPYGDFEFRGGHRLWHSPESMPRTYVPDNCDLIIKKTEFSVVLETPAEPITNIRKMIEIVLDKDKPKATIKHTLINDSLWPVELAPWAITQFRPGGLAIMPMPVESNSGFLPNRQLCFWPYASIIDPRFILGDDACFFRVDEITTAFKIGYYNPDGWLAYLIDGTLFKKTFSAVPDKNYPDSGCNAELYGVDRFVELESLSPMITLQPGCSTSHEEIWEVFDGISALPMAFQEKIKNLLKS